VNVAPSTLLPLPDVRGELVLRGDMVTGWCWSPSRPTQRLKVTLLIDSKRAASCIAARLRLDLVRPSICDGYHAFALPLPKLAEKGFSIIEAQEADSGRVFARIVSGKVKDVPEWMLRGEAIAQGLARVETSLGADMFSPSKAPLLTALKVTGQWLARKPDRITDQASLAPALRLPNVADPRVTLIIDAIPDRICAFACVARLAPLLRHNAAELLVIDDGRGAGSARLASLPGLSYCFVPTSGEAQHANRAAALARGNTLIFLCAEDAAAAALDHLLATPSRPQDVSIGGWARPVARRAGLGDPFPDLAHNAPSTGVMLLTPRGLFLNLGGFDDAVDDGVGLPALDFALRAQKVGSTVTFTDGSSLRYGLPGPLAVQARHTFLSRWRPPRNLVCPEQSDKK
jgi:hypothetical protein